MEMKRMSEYERTGKLQPKIDVYRVTGKTLTYLHSTNWHRTCREAVQAAQLIYGSHVALKASFA